MPEATERFLAAAAGGDAEAVLSALADGAASDARDAEGRTALMLACARGWRAVVRTILWAGTRPTQEDWMSAAALGDPITVLLLEKSEQEGSMPPAEWVLVLSTLAASQSARAGRPPAFGELNELRAALSELPSALSATDASLRLAGRIVPDSIRFLMCASVAEDEVADLVSLLARLLSAPGVEIPDAAALALYRLANAGRDIASALPPLLASAPTSGCAIAAMTMYADQGPVAREAVLAALRGANSRTERAARRVNEWLERGDVSIPYVRLTWTTSWSETSSESKGFSIVRVGRPVQLSVSVSPDTLHLLWDGPRPGLPRYQALRDFLDSGRPPLRAPVEPPPTVVRELSETVGGAAWRNLLGRKARLAERWRRQGGESRRSCPACASLGDYLYADGEKDETLPPEADRLQTLSQDQPSLLRTCRECGALFIDKTISDNSPNAPPSSYVLKRVGVEEAISFFGSDATRSPWLEPPE